MGFLFYIIAFFILLFMIQLTLKLKVLFNIKNNEGKLQLKFINIPVLNYKISIISQCLKITNKNGKSKYMPLILDQQSIKDYTDFESILFRKIYFKTVSVYFNFGIKSDAFVSAMVCGYIDIFSKILYTLLKTKKNEVLAKLKIYPTFNKNVIKIGIKAKISLSIFDLFWSFIEAILTKQIKAIKIKEFNYVRK